MKLQQLRFILAIAESDLNITQASEKLYTSQPGVSKQLRLLEDELGIKIFARNGKNLVGVTEEGKTILEKAQSIMAQINEIKEFSNEMNPERRPLPIQSFSVAA
ncbi:LysR family transcriptional regulator [Aliikangiella coralliicola]|uniref:LysR family transcriptional regulator n=1 Tax=Aliikangiella coralliicola TaxID=2592383 RepID=A0A545TZW9_9GAMM|nr:LysR family transcriptional regulator [Aliikangiella coralliicola]TQV82757.1 LysR family transcriptional regulator [Aliikangiella coralliicola]